MVSIPCALLPAQHAGSNNMKNAALVIGFLILAFIASMMLFPVRQTPVQASVSLHASSVHKGIQSHYASRGSYDVLGKPTITPEHIDRVLCSAQSLACGTGQALYDYGVQAGIDPAYALAFFHHESSYGLKGWGAANKSLGNIRCTSGYACAGGYRAYASWQAGYQDWYALIAWYAHTLNKRTIPDIIPTYAPSADNNNEAAYIASVEQDVDAMRGSK